jgi:two-component system, NtrC family, sensor histidine kinase HydH
MKINFTIRPKYLVFISLTIAFILIVISVFDIYEGKKDIYQAKTEEAVSLLRSVQKAGENVYISNEEVEKLIADKLIIAANFISKSESANYPSKKNLDDISNSTGIDHIYLFSSTGKLEVYNKNVPYSDLNISGNFSNDIDSLLKGYYDYFIIPSVKDSVGNQHFLVIHSKINREGYIAVSIGSEHLLEFRKKIGIGVLFNRIADEEDIKYLAIQDEEGIITASEKVKELSSISADKFLTEILAQKRISTREISYNGENILEAVKPFRVGNTILGVIRIGISLKSIDSLIRRTIIRSIVMSILLLLTGVIIIILITNNQNYSILKEEYKRIQTYTGNILDNMSDGVIAVNGDSIINLFNKGSEKIFKIDAETIIGKKCSEVIISPENLIDKTLINNKPIDYWEHMVETKLGKKIIIGGSTSIIRNADKSLNTVIAVVRDMTSQRNTEEFQKRQEKLTAMGELAGSVAHEIKNPLNSIGITVQRFQKEFTPVNDKDEYFEMIRTMKSEVNRVSEIINQFLKFAKPPKINKQKTNVKELLCDVYKSFESQAISSKKKFNYYGDELEANIDHSQMKHALENLLQNAFDAVGNNGEIGLESFRNNDNLIIRVIDNGKGISENDKDKIYNLYFTTKQNGTGLGLSIVNQIITEHKGKIKVESEINKGTTFTIELPIV